MIDYLALLKQRVAEKHPLALPTKPTKAPFDSFGSDPSRRFSRIEVRISDEWIAGLNRLKMVEPLPALASRWPQIVADLATFLPAWGQQAMSLGWTTADIIGVHPAAPDSRWDVAGSLAGDCRSADCHAHRRHRDSRWGVRNRNLSQTPAPWRPALAAD